MRAVAGVSWAVPDGLADEPTAREIADRVLWLEDDRCGDARALPARCGRSTDMNGAEITVPLTRPADCVAAIRRTLDLDQPAHDGSGR